MCEPDNLRDYGADHSIVQVFTPEVNALYSLELLLRIPAFDRQDGPAFPASGMLGMTDVDVWLVANVLMAMIMWRVFDSGSLRSTIAKIGGG